MRIRHVHLHCAAPGQDRAFVFKVNILLENVSNDNLNIEIEGVVNDTDVMAKCENISDSADDQDTAATTVATPMVESENIVKEDKTISGNLLF